MNKLILVILAVLFAGGAQAAILCESLNGASPYIPASLSVAATSNSCRNTSVVVTSALSAVQSNISSATVHAWPADRALKVEKGGSIGNTTTFTINGPFSAGNYQVFAGTGAVTGLKESYLEWFGVKADGSTDNGAALNKAVAASTTVRTKLKGVIKTSIPIVLTSGTLGAPLSFQGTGNATIFQQTDNTKATFQIAGHVEIGHLQARNTARTGKIIEVTAAVERSSRLHDMYLNGAEYPIYASGQNVYSTIFENLELGDYTNTALYLNCPGATGNVYTNIYTQNWQTYPTVKNTATAAIKLEGSHTEGVMNQINIEHTKNSYGMVLNGVENFVINSLHIEGFEANSNFGALIFGIGRSTSATNIVINGMNVVFSTFASGSAANYNLFRLDTGNTQQATLMVNGYSDRDLTVTSTLKRAYRGGTTTNTPDPVFDLRGFQSGVFLTDTVAANVGQQTYLPDFNKASYSAGARGSGGASVVAAANVVLTAEEYDIGGMYDVATGHFLAPVKGMYLCKISLPTTSLVNAGEVFVKKNFATYETITSNGHRFIWEAVLPFNKNESFYAYFSTGQYTNNDTARISMQLIK